jgi:signal peptidase I
MIALLGLLALLAAPRKTAPPSCATTIEQRTVRGTSLRGALEPGQTVRIERGHYRCHPAERGELVIYHPPGRATPIIKFVRGVPGDRLAITAEGGIEINDVELRTSLGEPYRIPPRAQRMLALYVGTIPPNAYLILGNRPAGSTDATRFGLVARADLRGRATLLVDQQRVPVRAGADGAVGP